MISQLTPHRSGEGRTGVVHGRFQVFHNDHLRVVLAAKRLCDYLVIGITSPNAAHAPLELIDPHRKEHGSNPLTYYERLSMISACMLELGWSANDFAIVPFPIETPTEIANYAPANATYYINIYDEWGEEKLRRLQELGLETHVLWRTNDKGLSGSNVRAAIAAGQEWEDLVPRAVAQFLIGHGLTARIRDLLLQ